MAPDRGHFPRETVPAAMVGLGRLERPTSPLSGVRSNHLSYRPEHGRTAARRAALPITHCPEKKEKRRRRRPAKWGLTGPFVPRVPTRSAQDGRLDKGTSLERR